MTRSLRVQRNCIDRVRLALKHSGFPSQRSLSEEIGFSLSTVSNFLTGKPIDYCNFEELCRKLSLDWREISALESEASLSSADTNNGSDFELLTAGHSPCYPSGAVPPGSSYYLEQVPLQGRILQELKKPGSLVRIKAPREMGKTSLLLRVLEAANQLGYQTVSINLEQAEQTTLSDLNQFLRWLCANTARQLQLKPMLDSYWDQDLGSKLSCTHYFQENLLKNSSAPCVLALDELNQIFEHPQVAKDFLPLLRSWHEQAKILPIWQKLRLIVVHATDIYVPLQLNQSPFNVGLPINLNPFSPAEVQQLAQCYGLDWSGGQEVGQLMDIVDGHPALVHITIYHLSQGEERLPQLLANASTMTGIYNNHLQRLWVILKEQPELSNALAEVLDSGNPVQLEPIVMYKLSSMGLIKVESGKAIPSCRLYRHYFKPILLRESKV